MIGVVGGARWWGPTSICRWNVRVFVSVLTLRHTVGWHAMVGSQFCEVVRSPPLKQIILQCVVEFSRKLANLRRMAGFEIFAPCLVSWIILFPAFCGQAKSIWPMKKKDNVI